MRVSVQVHNGPGVVQTPPLRRNTRRRAIRDPAACVSTQGQGWSKHSLASKRETEGDTAPVRLMFRAREGQGGVRKHPPHQNTRQRGIQQPSVSHFERGRGTGWWQSRTPPPSRVWSEEGPSCILMQGRAGGGRNASRRVDGG